MSTAPATSGAAGSGDVSNSGADVTAPKSRRKNGRRRRHAIKRKRHEDAASDGEDRVRYDPTERAQMPHLVEDALDDDLRLVKEELGYLPGHLRRIAARDAAGRPAVLQLYPLGISRSYKRRKRQRHTGDSAEPFPTMLWLVSKRLGLQVARLEYQGGVATMEKRLGESAEEVRAAQRAAHEGYAAARWALVNEEDRKLCDERSWTERLRDSGVAGMANFDTVKCLHAHYAHHLAIQDGSLFADAGAGAPGGAFNHVGAWVHEALAKAEEEEGDAAAAEAAERPAPGAKAEAEAGDAKAD